MCNQVYVFTGKANIHSIAGMCGVVLAGVRVRVVGCAFLCACVDVMGAGVAHNCASPGISRSSRWRRGRCVEFDGQNGQQTPPELIPIPDAVHCVQTGSIAHPTCRKRDREGAVWEESRAPFWRDVWEERRGQAQRYTPRAVALPAGSVGVPSFSVPGSARGTLRPPPADHAVACSRTSWLVVGCVWASPGAGAPGHDPGTFERIF